MPRATNNTQAQQVPTKDAVNQFLAARAQHMYLNAAYERAQLACEHPAKDMVVMIVGPTGAGKSTLLDRLLRWIMETHVDEIEQDPSRLAAYMLQLQAYDIYNWKDHYIHELRVLGDPFVDELLRRELRGVHRNVGGDLLLDNKIDVATLRRAVENCIRYRHIRVALWDEASHLLKVGPGASRVYAQMEAVKSRVSATQAVHVLAGTYELLDLANQNDQVSRRTVIIHLPRYKKDVQAEWEAYLGVLLAFQKRLPMPEQPDLLAESEYIYERSLGCVGIAKEWLDRALVLAVSDMSKGKPRATHIKPFRYYLDSTTKSDAELISILTTTLEGEHQVWQMNNDKARLSALLTQGLDALDMNGGYTTGPGRGRNAPAIGNLLGTSKTKDTTLMRAPNGRSRAKGANDSKRSNGAALSAESAPGEAVGTTRKVGERNPHRDKVGPLGDSTVGI